MNPKPKCPICGKKVSVHPSNKWRPFCSERCKLIDLGAWIDGINSIPGDEVNFEEFDNDDVETKH